MEFHGIMHTSLTAQRSAAGFTLGEIMVSLLVLSLVMAGASSLYAMGIRVWRNTSARMDASSSASTALTRCTLGTANSLGLRAAFHPVQISSNSAGWTITFVAPASMLGDTIATNALKYSVANRTITYEPSSGTPSVIARNIVSSRVMQQTNTVSITVRARARVGRKTVESEMSSSVMPRNRI